MPCPGVRGGGDQREGPPTDCQVTRAASLPLLTDPCPSQSREAFACACFISPPILLVSQSQIQGAEAGAHCTGRCQHPVLQRRGPGPGDGSSRGAVPGGGGGHPKAGQGSPRGPSVSLGGPLPRAPACTALVCPPPRHTLLEGGVPNDERDSGDGGMGTVEDPVLLPLRFVCVAV